jgi:hypothetical protein
MTRSAESSPPDALLPSPGDAAARDLSAREGNVASLPLRGTGTVDTSPGSSEGPGGCGSGPMLPATWLVCGKASVRRCSIEPAECWLQAAGPATTTAEAAEEEESDKAVCPLFLARGARPGKRALALAGALVEASDAPGEDSEEDAREEVRTGALDRSTGVVRRPGGARAASTASTAGSRLVSRRVGDRPVRHDPLAAAPRRGRSAAVGEAQVLLRLWGGL